MKTETIVGTIQDSLNEYEKAVLDCNPVFAPTQKQIVELVDLYSMDKFRDNSYDELGFLKPFYNVIDTPLQVAVNYIDLDVKDIQFMAEDGQSYYPVWLLEEDARMWMKENVNCYADGRWMDFGLFLNAIVFSWPKYGHIVIKKASDKIYLMPISNLYVEPTADSLTNAQYIIEKHDYSPYELRQKNWDNIEEAIRECEVDGHIFVYELFSNIEEEKDNYFIVAVPPHEYHKDMGRGVLLFSDSLKELPYKELPFEKITGRWLGKGQIEKLFHAQIYQNRIAEYKARGAHWTSKHIYQSRDAGIDRNLMTGVKDGRVLEITSEITPIAVEERNLHFYRDEEARYDALVDKRSFSWDTMRGERPPAGLTLGQTMIQSRAAGGFFQRKQEELGLFIKEVLYDWILPSFKKDRKSFHKLMLGEFDDDRLSKIRNLLINKRHKDETLSFIKRTNKIPTTQERDILKGVITEKIQNEKEIAIPKSFYENIRTKIKIVITGEQIDLSARINAIQQAMVMISQNPTILQDPDSRKLFMELMDMAGISPTKFDRDEEGMGSRVQQMTAQLEGQQVAQRGGSVARMPATAPAGGMPASGTPRETALTTL